MLGGHVLVSSRSEQGPLADYYEHYCKFHVLYEAGNFLATLKIEL